MIYLKKYFQREGKGGSRRGRGTSMGERIIHQLLLAHPQPGTWPANQACALTGNRTGDLLVLFGSGRHLIH